MKPLVFGATSTNSLTRSAQSLGLWLNALAVVQQPTRIVHVGIGDGKGESSVWTDWPLTKALAIEVEPITIAVLNTNSQFKALIDVQSQLIAETEGSVAYFVASNPSENGLIDPSLLRMVWPSLTLSHQTQRDATTLDRAAADILNVSTDHNAEPLWLIIDALPGVRILNGGAKLLEASSLVCVRALAEAGFHGEPAGADVAAVDRLLEEKGFNRVIYLPDLNPKIGHAIYARKKSLDVISPAEIEALQAKLDATSQERDAAQANAEALTVKLKTKETALETELGQVQRLRSENQELIHRQQLMNDELMKAEGQISLIKDLLLREQGI